MITSELLNSAGMLDILGLEDTHALDGDTVPIIILLFTQDGSTESEVFLQFNGIWS